MPIVSIGQKKYADGRVFEMYVIETPKRSGSPLFERLSLPICLPGMELKIMSEKDSEAITKRAKELCAQDGFAWELDFTLPYPPAGHLRGSHYPSDERRQHYLAQARAELDNGESASDD